MTHWIRVLAKAVGLGLVASEVGIAAAYVARAISNDATEPFDALVYGTATFVAYVAAGYATYGRRWTGVSSLAVFLGICLALVVAPRLAYGLRATSLPLQQLTQSEPGLGAIYGFVIGCIYTLIAVSWMALRHQRPEWFHR